MSNECPVELDFRVGVLRISKGVFTLKPFAEIEHSNPYLKYLKSSSSMESLE
jgi:hypothetical protein